MVHIHATHTHTFTHYCRLGNFHIKNIFGKLTFVLAIQLSLVKLRNHNQCSTVIVHRILCMSHLSGCMYSMKIENISNTVYYELAVASPYVGMARKQDGSSNQCIIVCTAILLPGNKCSCLNLHSIL